jgi:hypothetical protein
LTASEVLQVTARLLGVRRVDDAVAAALWGVRLSGQVSRFRGADAQFKLQHAYTFGCRS